MKITIKNLFNFGKFECEIKDGVTLVTGENQAGKTSLARIIAALAAHERNPAGIAATLTRNYIRRGEDSGLATTETGLTWEPPDKILNPQGEAPISLPHCVGLIDFMHPPSTSRLRAKLYEKLSKMVSNEELLKPAWKEHGLPERQLASVLELVDNDSIGWSGAAQVYEGHKKEAGRRWSKLTNSMRYSAKRAPNWVPDSWESDLEGMSESDILAECTNANDALRACGVRVAIQQHDIDKAIKIRDEVMPKRMEQLEDAKVNLADLTDDSEAAEAKSNEADEIVETALSVARRAETELNRASDELLRFNQSAESGRIPEEIVNADMEEKVFCARWGQAFADAAQDLRLATEELKAIESEKVPEAPPTKACPCGKKLIVGKTTLSVLDTEGLARSRKEWKSSHAERLAKVKTKLKEAQERTEDAEGQAAFYEAEVNRIIQSKFAEWKSGKIAELKAEEKQKREDHKRANEMASAAKLEATAARDTFRKADGRRREARAKLAGIQRSLEELVADTKLADEEAVESNEAERAQHENELRRAHQRKVAWETKQAADKAHREYQANEHIAYLLGPSGVREAAGRPTIDLIRQQLDVISQRAGWLPIELDAGYQNTSGGMPIQLASHNERYKAQWAMQLAIARVRTDVQVVVLDACDIVRGKSWEGLINICNLISSKRRVIERGPDGKPSKTAPPPKIVVCATETEAPVGWNKIDVGA